MKVTIATPEDIEELSKNPFVQAVLKGVEAGRMDAIRQSIATGVPMVTVENGQMMEIPGEEMLRRLTS